MSIKKVSKEFKLVGLKGSGEFVTFGNEVPLLAKQLLSRSNEILNATETEIALFEPKKGENHSRGHYYVGLIVNKKVNKVPTGMEYIETNNNYITIRGNMSNLRELHLKVLNWSEERGYERDLDSYIVETYHPNEVEEEVQIYLPIQA
ncbi:GyrI-like domain-containing protein [Jeotgalibacillus proteolyticus]|uniref:GyrI-like domain-containing protein n=1 Tax=Jeotgalibacillus proteolyticus TaxID=2082395 RepID=UPI003CF2E5FF